MVIPARAGSKRIPNKNLAKVNGYSILEWTIRAAMKLPHIDGVYVSTDGEAIAQHARDLCAQVIDRPAELGGDTTTTEDVLVHAINHIGAKDIDIAILMEATQPLKDYDALKMAVTQMLLDTSMSSMFLAHECPLFIWDEACRSVTYDYKMRGRTQTMQRYFQECGDYLFRVDTFLKTKNRINGIIGIQPCNRFAQLDIDDPEDLQFINAVAREFNLKPVGIL